MQQNTTTTAATEAAQVQLNSVAFGMSEVEITTAALEAQNEQAALTAGQLAYANLTKLRTAADKHLSNVIAQGRKAKLELVGKIYAEYFAVMSCNETAALVAKIEQQLKAEKIAYRVTTPAGTKLVRFVFSNYNDEDLTSKEAFQYSRAMDVAFEQGREPATFEAFVVSNGGFAGIMKKFPVAVVTTEATGSVTGAVTLEALRQSPTSSAIEVKDWTSGEEFRVYIAVRSDDTDEGMLKVLHASKQAIEKFMAICEAERKANEKPAKDAAAAAKKLAKLQLESELHYAELALAEVEIELRAAIKAHDTSASSQLGVDVVVKAAAVAVAKDKLKAIKGKKTSTTAA